MKRLGLALGAVAVVAVLVAGCGGGGTTDDPPRALDGQEVVDELSVVAKVCNARFNSDAAFAAEQALVRLEKIAKDHPHAAIRASKAIQGELGGLERGLNFPLTARPIGRTIEDAPNMAGTISDVLTAVENTYGICFEGSALNGLRKTLRGIGGQ